MSKGSIELVDPIIVNKIVLLRKKYSTHTFQEKIFGFYASRVQCKFSVQQFKDQQTSYGTLPLIIINQNHIIHQNQFISFAQALYQPSPQLYILQKGVINACMRLKDLNNSYEIQNLSSHWLIFNPLRRLREYLTYKKQLKLLQIKNISPDQNQNKVSIQKAISQFQSLLQLKDQFSRIIQYLCLDYIFSHKNQICIAIKNNQTIIDQYKKGLPEQKVRLSTPIIAEIKKLQSKKQQPPKKKDEESLEAILKTTLVLSLIWVPWLISRNRTIAQ